MRIAWLGSVFPEPDSSAAGWRSRDLIEDLLALPGATLDLFAFAQPTPRSLRSIAGLSITSVDPNCSQDWEPVRGCAPEVVIFDRFISEEKAAWRVTEIAPHALRVLDTQDLHALRLLRQASSSPVADESTDALAARVWASATGAREWAAIVRSDLSWVVSEYEQSLIEAPISGIRGLEGGTRWVEWLPFGYESAVLEQELTTPPLDRQEAALWVGNHRHPPNADAVQWLATQLWPQARARALELGARDPELWVAGAYPSQEITSWAKRDRSVRIWSDLESLAPQLRRARVAWYPLRFGAGIKGKVLEAFVHDCPVVTTSVGGEGIVAAHEAAPWVIDDPASMCERVAMLLAGVSPSQTLSAQLALQRRVLRERFERGRHRTRLHEQLVTRLGELSRLRQNRWLQQALVRETLRGHEYFSRWIELKGHLERAQQSSSGAT